MLLKVKCCPSLNNFCVNTASLWAKSNIARQKVNLSVIQGRWCDVWIKVFGWITKRCLKKSAFNLKSEHWKIGNIAAIMVGGSRIKYLVVHLSRDPSRIRSACPSKSPNHLIAAILNIGYYIIIIFCGTRIKDHKWFFRPNHKVIWSPLSRSAALHRLAS